MSLTNEQLTAIAKAHIDKDRDAPDNEGWSIYDHEFLSIMREVEQEATKIGSVSEMPISDAMKGQEPVAWVEVIDRHEGPYNFYGKELLDSGKHNLYIIPQPCPSYQLTAAEMSEAHAEGFTDPGDLWSSYKGLKAKVAELEAERDDWKSRYESNLSVNQMHSDNNAEMLKFTAKLLADIDALKKQNNAYATLTKAQEGRLVEYGSEKAKWLDAVATLDSEKEANTILTQERDALAMQVAKMRGKILEATIGSCSCTTKTDDHKYHVRLCSYRRLMEILELPDLSAEIIKRHDAGVLRKAAKHFYASEELIAMAMALEQDAK